jgi:hypothetical protein
MQSKKTIDIHTLKQAQMYVFYAKGVKGRIIGMFGKLSTGTGNLQFRYSPNGDNLGQHITYYRPEDIYLIAEIDRKVTHYSEEQLQSIQG